MEVYSNEKKIAKSINVSSRIDGNLYELLVEDAYRLYVYRS